MLVTPPQCTTVRRIQKQTTTGILLIHPNEVGIARWHHTISVYSKHLQIWKATPIATSPNHLQHMQLHPITIAWCGSVGHMRWVATDLIGSGTACTPTVTTAFSTQHSTRIPRHLPLLNSFDWTNQLLQHMELHRDDVDD